MQNVEIALLRYVQKLLLKWRETSLYGGHNKNKKSVSGVHFSTESIGIVTKMWVNFFRN